MSNDNVDLNNFLLVNMQTNDDLMVNDPTFNTADNNSLMNNDDENLPTIPQINNQCDADNI